MDLLITGICGFAGATIARGLLASREGLRIVGFDNLSRAGSETNLEPLRALGIAVSVGDIRDQNFLETLPPCSWVLDCAANPSVLAGVSGERSGVSASRELVEQNLYGTVNLLELCRRWNAGFILLSTSRVYSIGQLAKLPLKENGARFFLDDTSPGLPAGASAAGVAENFSTAATVSLYGCTKLCSEALALEYASCFGFPAWINRCGVLAGAGQFGKADQGIFSFWVHSWLAGRPLRFLGFGGRGLQVRDCLHPLDLVPAILAQMDAGQDATKPRVANFSGGAANSMSLRELSDWCAEHLGARRHGEDPRFPDPSAPPEPDRPFDIPWLVLDSGLARRVWGWRPSAGIGAVLEEIAEHARQNPGWLDLVAARN